MNIIRFLHVCFIIFFVTTPFVTNVPAHLFIHITCGFGILAHWLLSSDVCVLTIIEHKLFGTPMTDTFTNRLIGSVYRITNKDIKLVTVFLTIFSICKAIYLWKQSNLPLEKWMFPVRAG